MLIILQQQQRGRQKITRISARAIWATLEKIRPLIKTIIAIVIITRNNHIIVKINTNDNWIKKNVISQLRFLSFDFIPVQLFRIGPSWKNYWPDFNFTSLFSHLNLTLIVWVTSGQPRPTPNAPSSSWDDIYSLGLKKIAHSRYCNT